MGEDACYHVNHVPISFQESVTDLGVCVDKKLEFHQHISNIVHKAGGVPTSILRTTINQQDSFMLPLFTTHVHPLLEYASSVWNLGFVGDVRQLESVQRRWTREIHGLEGLDYSQRLRTLNLYSIKGRLIRHDFIKYWQIFYDHSAITHDDLFPRPLLSNTRGHDYKIAHTGTQLVVRKRYFSLRCVDLWNGLPAELVNCGNINKFKQGLAVHLGDLLFTYFARWIVLTP